MTRQEKLREGAARKLYAIGLGYEPIPSAYWESEFTHDIYLGKADLMIKYFHEQGFVRKVENGRDLTGCCIARLEPLI